MEQSYSMRVIAHIRSDFPTKFGIPRQSGLVEELTSTVVFTPEFRSGEALRGIEDFSHLWLIWVFDRAQRADWSPTVRPPRLGGNRRLGVFATRAPFRPNPIALSCVRLEGVRQTAEGAVLTIRGADLADGTPILDIKPYIPYADCRPDARHGYAPAPEPSLEVVIPEALEARIPPDLRAGLRAVLAQDPRPRYHSDPERSYGFGFAGWEIRFRVSGSVLTVTDAVRT